MNAVRRRWLWIWAVAFGALLSLPGLAAAAEDEDFDPSLEFELTPYVDLDFGFVDLSITKAVIYLWIASAICIIFGLIAVFGIRGGMGLKPNRIQNAVELAYEFAEDQIAKPTLSEKTFHRYFPFIATLFLFIAASNLVSFVPLPVSHESGTFPGGLPDLGLYAATANINVTLTLTILVFVAYNVEGVKAHGPVGYLKTMIPDAPGAIKPVIFVLELLSQILRLVSLSVRLFANLLAGHLLIIMAAGFVILLGSFIGVLALPVGIFFYLFEWVMIAGLQAYIFAMLSGIYIGYAVEPPH